MAVELLRVKRAGSRTLLHDRRHVRALAASWLNFCLLALSARGVAVALAVATWWRPLRAGLDCSSPPSPISNGGGISRFGIAVTSAVWLSLIAKLIWSGECETSSVWFYSYDVGEQRFEGKRPSKSFLFNNVCRYCVFYYVKLVSLRGEDTLAMPKPVTFRFLLIPLLTDLDCTIFWAAMAGFEEVTLFCICICYIPMLGELGCTLCIVFLPTAKFAFG